jgi:hypothetical protein
MVIVRSSSDVAFAAADAISGGMRPASLLSLLLALLPVSSGPEPRPMLGSRADMRAEPVALSTRVPAARSLGALTYLGGVRLSSRDPAFGGFSAMLVKGDRFTLLSDGGNLVRFRMGADWRPSDIVFGDLPGGPSTGARKAERDAEAMAADPVTGAILVAFEGANTIWRYDPVFRTADRHVAPAAMAKWPSAGGAESMARLRSGAFVVLSEAQAPKGRDDARVGLVFAGDPTANPKPRGRFAYVPPPRYDPTDVAELPDGRLLVLNRRLSLAGLFTAKLTVIDLRGAKSGALVHGREIASFAAPALHDNFEALAVTHENAETILWIASDDNSQFWEQSLLLKFRLDLPAEPRR